MVFALVGGLSCLTILAALAWHLSGEGGRDVARYWLITVFRWFN